MQFVFPSFLWALALVAIPIIIHLFRFRRFRTVFFSNVAFLKEIKQESNKQSKLKHLLVLASRILAILFLVLAFAQPFIPAQNHTAQIGKKFVSIYLDNSFSMGATDGAKSLLDEAKNTAREIAKGYAANDVFQLLTNDFSGRQQFLVSKEQFLGLLDEVTISPASRSWSEIQKRQEDALAAENSENRIAYLISDFQKNMGELSESATVQNHLIPLNTHTQANLYIDSCFFYNPVQLMGQKNEQVVRIKNTGNDDAENLRVTLTINGETKALSNPTVPAKSTVFDTLRFTISQRGWNNATIALEDYPITFDDSYFTSFFVPEKLYVLQIKESGSGNFVDAVFQNQAEFDFTTTTTGNIQYANFNRYQLIVLTNVSTLSSGLISELGNYLDAGGNVLVFPNELANVASLNEFLNATGVGALGTLQQEPQEVSAINLQHRLVRNVFDKVPQNMQMPNAKKHFSFTQGNAVTENIITLKNKQPLWLSSKVKNGNVYVCTSPLDSKINELVVHAMFAPILFEMGIAGASAQVQTGVIGEKNAVAVNALSMRKESVLKVSGEKNEFIPQQTNIGQKVLLNMGDQILTSGFYKVFSENTDSAQFIAMNYSRAESDLQFETADDLQTNYPKLNVLSLGGHEAATLAQELGRGTTLWKFCLWATLFFLAIEIGLLLFWKK